MIIGIIESSGRLEKGQKFEMKNVCLLEMNMNRLISVSLNCLIRHALIALILIILGNMLMMIIIIATTNL